MEKKTKQKIAAGTGLGLATAGAIILGAKAVKKAKLKKEAKKIKEEYEASTEEENK